ncbi:MAG: hypothetical protein AABO58_01865 [Acidobacteriota bacterium]
MRDITVRFAGTCCFINSGTFKRVVLPNDTLESGEKRHIAYVEFPDEYIRSGHEFLTEPYKHGDTGQVDYRRFDLVGHTITIENLSSSSPAALGSYTNHVPKMSAVHPGLYPQPRPECFVTPPNPILISGAINLTSGILTAGQLYEFITVFENEELGETARVQTPQYVDLTVPIDSNDLTVKFDDGTHAVQVVVEPGADLITIGNQPLADIQQLGSGDDVAHHFKLYYKLGKPGTVMPNPPLPRKLLDPVNSCTVTQWP